MRRLGSWIVGVGALALIASPAFAQGQGRGGFGMMGGGGLGALLGNESVQKELKLDDSQLDKVKAIADDAREKGRGIFQQLQDVPQEERGAKMQELMSQVNADVKKSLKDVLKDGQLKRLEQIDLQVRGARAFNDAEVAKKLKLTDDQKGKIRDIQADADEQRRDAFQSAQGGDRQAAMEKIQKIGKETNDKVLAVLTTEQKATWKELTGEPFAIQMQPPRRPGGDR